MRYFGHCLLVACLSLGIWLVPASAAPAPSSYIVVLDDSVADPASVAEAHGHAHGFQAKFVYSHAMKGYAATLTADAAAVITDDPRVLFVALDRVLHLAVQSPTPPQPAQVPSFGVRRIDSDLSSTASGDGHGSVPINVAILDSGIDPRHPDLVVGKGVNCADGGRGDTRDVLYHGTMVAGLVGALDNGIGRVGVAPGATLIPVRVSDADGFIPESDLLCGIEWVTSTRNDRNRTNDIAVANMSLGSLPDDPREDDGNCGLTNGDPTHLAICNLVAAGVTPVASAGNETLDFALSYPATYQEVLAVTAMEDNDGEPGGLGVGQPSCPDLPFELQDDTEAFFSNFATLPEDQAHTVAAPGVCIGSTYPGGLYASDSGTSYSAPLLSGTVALCIASGPCAGLTPAQIVTKIVADAAAYNNANLGYGFEGDPNHPIPDMYYGYLVRAALY
jgi:subtilisin